MVNFVSALAVVDNLMKDALHDRCTDGIRN